jgi:hypothetical protein
MIPDEILRRRFPPSYGYRIPHSEFIDQADPSYSGEGECLRHEMEFNRSGNLPSNDSHQEEEAVQGLEDDGSNRRKFQVSPSKLFPSSYKRRMAADSKLIATDITKYLSSNYVNPLGNSSYFENRRRMMRSSFSF